jgi:hypothetical protein
MLAAFGERDAERARGSDGIVEEQLVEIAHAIEQQRYPGLFALISIYCSIIGVMVAGWAAVTASGAGWAWGIRSQNSLRGRWSAAR